ncbi:MAG: sigma-70 family RNA polymerase sigma factor [Achromobacter sp.]|uniref:sigma-70 family RNA polymerase sigma factor n=1 Tax=Achromobacter sp. TaxID=134375 RepID=UPI002582E39C|nr:sigma-70 family RNA polymerase sigma factor [Achromobacter sp.]MCW0208373.1 sigma-70 family RNA polymerase sigma factor [Achromobacter sp.]
MSRYLGQPRAAEGVVTASKIENDYQNHYNCNLPAFALSSMSARLKKDWLAHYRDLFGILRRKDLGREDSEDALHDTVQGMLENGVGAIQDPRAYLARGISNRLISRHRHARALEMLPLDELGEASHSVAPGAETHVRCRQLADALASALEELPLKCRQIYVRHRLEGQTHSEIAQEMGLSRSMVEKYMTRALRHLEERLDIHAPY